MMIAVIIATAFSPSKYQPHTDIACIIFASRFLVVAPIVWRMSQRDCTSSHTAGRGYAERKACSPEEIALCSIIGCAAVCAIGALVAGIDNIASTIRSLA